MALALPVVLAIGLGTLLGGSPGRLGALRLRLPGLFLAAFAIQVVAFPFDLLPWRMDRTAATVLWLVSYALLTLAAFVNLRTRGVAVVALGMLMNLTAIVANGGTMPVRYEAMHQAGRVDVTYANSTAMAEPHVGLLVDRWAAPSWVPFANVFSVGDVVIAIGAFVVVLAAMGIPRPGFVPRAGRV